ncbi:MAG: T9SS type A sorting domain-containing protein [Saprospiraceae bacterium]|nr:T9SS type A sorting domain-containing protein [Saprospiraceae bacterium]
MRYSSIFSFIVILLLTIDLTRGQNRSAPEWAPIGATWHYNYGGPDPYFEFIRIESIKDTTINGIPARLLRQTLVHDHEGDEEDLGNIYLQQVRNRINHFIYDSFHLLYDFDVQVGDTLYIVNPPRLIGEGPSTSLLRVDSVFIAEIQGVAVRAQTVWVIEDFKAERRFFSNFIYEGIGNLSYLIPAFTESGCDHACPLLNCYEDGSLMYHHPLNIPCDTINRFIISVDDLFGDVDINVSPNPVLSGQPFKIEIRDSYSTHPLTFSIYDLVGHQIVKKKWISKEAQEGQVMNLPKGIYFIKVESVDGQVTKKLVSCHM